ncbi:hypothetical protein K402DRAFT_401403 [Aulographum hederae CBS 113979]|uniref:Uncharacterized protein n=1 Tax=Aulographum hederae CBS 113979 TaxID=1176131 RepID=A0A6G1HA10_9PEZI|nr:hypothetical protein K402DRAFT_401403 [Aulographum hederae CBS 113979]
MHVCATAIAVGSAEHLDAENLLEDWKTTGRGWSVSGAVGSGEPGGDESDRPRDSDLKSRSKEVVASRQETVEVFQRHPRLMENRLLSWTILPSRIGLIFSNSNIVGAERVCPFVGNGKQSALYVTIPSSDHLPSPATGTPAESWTTIPRSIVSQDHRGD